MINVIYYIVWGILILDTILLIMLVLAQESKSQGLGGLGGGMDMSFGGHTQRTAKRMTAICGVIFGAGIIAITLLMPHTSSRSSLPGGANTPEPSIAVPQLSLQPGENPVPERPAPAEENMPEENAPADNEGDTEPDDNQGTPEE
ncbi:MAG: preprotein translocase subunit SecG [Planctomycetota bacterium]|nr:preprotein translocase subunit SecG [Planctomycetota bacterium]